MAGVDWACMEDATTEYSALARELRGSMAGEWKMRVEDHLEEWACAPPGSPEDEQAAGKMVELVVEGHRLRAEK